MVISFINWPIFNMAGATISSIIAASTANCQSSAIANTLLGLSAAILVAILFASK